MSYQGSDEDKIPLPDKTVCTHEKYVMNVIYPKPYYIDLCYKEVALILQESKAKEALTRKQQKNRSKQQMFVEDDKKTELLQKPREYQVKFTIPNPSPLNPPILGISSKCWGCNLKL